MYPCVPDYQIHVPADPFDYKLRTKEEVMEEHKYFPPDLLLKMHYRRYMATDTREHVDTNTESRDRVAKIEIDIREFCLAPLQRERFVFLLGPRYNPLRPYYCKIVCRQYATFAENFLKANELLREIYWESLRAPSTLWNCIRNPYMRDKLKKKKLGATKELRKIAHRENQQAIRQYYKKREVELVE